MLRARPDTVNRATLQAAQDRPCYPVLGNYKLGGRGMCATVMTTSWGRAVAVPVTMLSLVVAISIFAAPLATAAQPAEKVQRIGYLSAGSATSSPRAVEAFRQGLRELGWVEGQNIVIEYRRAEGRFDRLPDLAAELVRLKVDVFVAGPTPVAVAAKKATGTIPIVMFGVGDPVGLGLIASLARPGGNLTGLSFSVGMDTFGKGLELLKEAVPKVRRVAILSNPANPAHALAISNVKAAAGSLGGGRRPHVLRAEHRCRHATRGVFRGQDPQGRQAR